ERAAGKRPVELVERPGGRQAPGALDQRALELAAQLRLERAQRVARQALPPRVLAGQVGLGLGAETQRTANPLHVDADDARALALAAEGGDRQPREIAHRALVAVA